MVSRQAAVATLVWLCACASSRTPSPAGAAGPDPVGAGSGAAEDLRELCARPGADVVRDVFCAAAPPPIASLADLQALLGIATGPAALTQSGDTTSAVVLTSHSTALSGRLVSPINPRAIFASGKSNAGLAIRVIMAFQRGTQQVELIAVDRNKPRFNFYLVTFGQACNERERGCLPGDLFTPRIETDWLSVAVQDDEDLKNTRLDCRRCHQLGIREPILLMRELRTPWTHFFGTDIDPSSGSPAPGPEDLVRDYGDAKGDEAYAGIPPAGVRSTAPIVLESLMGMTQPLFRLRAHSRGALAEGPDGYPAEPSRSATWDAAYGAFKRGERLALPYFAERVTDPDKQASLTQAYGAYLSGQMAADDLPDLADIFPDDAQVRAEIGLQTEPGATPVDALIQACASCHNDVLDQGISRARFSVALSRLDDAEIQKAIARIELPEGAPGVMPPPEARQLDVAARIALLEYLQTPDRPANRRRSARASGEARDVGDALTRSRSSERQALCLIRCRHPQIGRTEPEAAGDRRPRGSDYGRVQRAFGVHGHRDIRHLQLVDAFPVEQPESVVADLEAGKAPRRPQGVRTPLRAVVVPQAAGSLESAEFPACDRPKIGLAWAGDVLEDDARPGRRPC